MVQGAIERWRLAGISAEEFARLQALRFEIADLPYTEIAKATSTSIKIDELAAGYGWFFDQSPWEDSEFTVGVPERELQTTEYSLAHGKMDLLTVIMRELGKEYLKGKKEMPESLRPLMDSTLSPSVRRLADASTIGFIIPEIPEIVIPQTKTQTTSTDAADSSSASSGPSPF